MDYEAHHKDFFSQKLEGYQRDESIPPQLCFKYELVERIEEPQLEIKKRVYDSSICYRENGNRICYLKRRATGEIIQIIEHSPDFSFCQAAAIHMEPTERVLLTDCDREYLRSGAAFNNRLIYLGGTTLHGSCIAYKGQGVIFSAPCGTGKSTHTSLWKQIFKEDVEYINDDKPAITFKEGEILVSGAPWSGKTNLQVNKTVPLKAIVFIERAEENSIERIDVPTAVCYLRDQTFPPFYAPELAIKNMDAIEKIIKTVPIYKLSCNMEPAAAELCNKEIFK